MVHRDLKPGNVMLTKAGAKLLDFGLAKQQVLSSFANPPSSLSPLARGTTGGQTATLENESLTEEGMILGTLEYMAPEQVEGKPVDARTDIFALGVVIYEMATGKKAFQGESKASLAAAILTSDLVPITRILPSAPIALERSLGKCLNKDPEHRWQSARDLTGELKWILEDLASSKKLQRLQKQTTGRKRHGENERHAGLASLPPWLSRVQGRSGSISPGCLRVFRR